MAPLFTGLVGGLNSYHLKGTTIFPVNPASSSNDKLWDSTRSTWLKRCSPSHPPQTYSSTSAATTARRSGNWGSASQLSAWGASVCPRDGDSFVAEFCPEKNARKKFGQSWKLTDGSFLQIPKTAPLIQEISVDFWVAMVHLPPAS